MKLIVLLKFTTLMQLIQKNDELDYSSRFWANWSCPLSVQNLLQDPWTLKPRLKYLKESPSTQTSFSAPVQTSRPKTVITNVWGDIGLQELKKQAEKEMWIANVEARQKTRTPPVTEKWDPWFERERFSTWLCYYDQSDCELVVLLSQDCKMKRLGKIPSLLIWAP